VTRRRGVYGGIEILETIGTPEAFRIIDRMAKGNADSLATVASRNAIARKQRKGAALPEIPKPRESPVAQGPPVPPGPVRADREGDPMPPGAIARLGSARWRLANEPRRIIVSPDGKRVAVIDNFASAEVFDSRTGRRLERARTGIFNWGIDLRLSVALSADWRKIAAVEGDDRSGTVLAILDRAKAEKVKIKFARDKESHPVVPEEIEAGSHSSHIAEYLSSAAFSPDGKTLLGAVHFQWGCSNFKITREVNETHLVAWDAKGKETWKTPAQANEVNTILFAPDGKTVIVVDQAGVGFRNVGTGRELRRWPSKEPLFSARLSPDGAWLAAGSKDAVLIQEVRTGKVRRLAVSGKEIRAVAFSPDGSLLAGGGDKSIRFWDPKTGKSPGDCTGFPKRVEAVEFSSDGKTLFSGHERIPRAGGKMNATA
jgi:WD40 repeat protein